MLQRRRLSALPGDPSSGDEPVMVPGFRETRRALLHASLASPLLLAVALGGCSKANDGIRGSGTIELNEVDIASLVGGRVSLILVNEGDSVRTGDALVVLAQGEVTAGVHEQEAEVGRASALAHDQELGPRIEERRAAEADLDTAEAALQLAESELARVRALFQKQLIAQSDLDRTQTSRNQAAARRDGASERYRLLQSGFRRQVVAAALRGAEAARAGLASARAKAHELV